LRLAIAGKICFHIIHFELFVQISANIILKIVILVGENILVIFNSVFVIRKFRGTCSSLEILKRYMARESLISPALKLTPLPLPRVSFGGLSHPNTAPSFSELKHARV